MMKELDPQPSLFVNMEMSDHLIYEKLEQRRYDPYTKKYHFVLYEGITDEKILDRLVHKFEDQHPQIKKKLIEYRHLKQAVNDEEALAEFSSRYVVINAEEDLMQVLKNLEQAIETNIEMN